MGEEIVEDIENTKAMFSALIAHDEESDPNTTTNTVAIAKEDFVKWLMDGIQASQEELAEMEAKNGKITMAMTDLRKDILDILQDLQTKSLENGKAMSVTEAVQSFWEKIDTNLNDSLEFSEFNKMVEDCHKSRKAHQVNYS